jgi:uncharacterized membrane protein
MRAMDPIPPPPVPPPPPPLQQPVSDMPAKVVYALYLASLVLGVTALVGVVVAYVYQGEAPEALRTHYRYQIRTFWIGLLYAVVSGLLVVAFIGFLGLIFVAVWIIVRCVKGFQRLSQHQPIPDPATWLW